MTHVVFDIGNVRVRWDPVPAFERELQAFLACAIFENFCARAGLTPQECLFIDDSAANVGGARAAGLAAHYFKTPETLEGDLTDATTNVPATIAAVQTYSATVSSWLHRVDPSRDFNQCSETAV